MTYGELKRRVMELVFSYSVAGTPLPAAYNNQADYLGMIPALVNQAQTDIATSKKRLYAYAKVSELEKEEIDGLLRFRLPDDCWLPLTSHLLPVHHCFHHTHSPYAAFRIIGGKYIELNPCHAESLILEYWRYPKPVTDDTSDETELDNTPDVHECIVLYVAAHLLIYDDAYRYSVLNNEYLLRKSQLREPVWLEVRPINNLYDVHHF